MSTASSPPAVLPQVDPNLSASEGTTSGGLGEQGASIEHGPEEEPKDIDEVALAELLTSHKWYQPPVTTFQTYHFHSLASSPLIPSPYAGFRGPVDLSKWSEAVRQFWQKIDWTAAFPETFENGTAYLAGLRSQTSASSSEEDAQGDEAGFLEAIGAGEISWKFPLSQFAAADHQNPTLAMKNFYLRRLQRHHTSTAAQSGEGEGFFIVNQDCDRLTVNNGHQMTRGTVAGPLSNFAIIEIDSVVLFWWRNASALLYTPTASKRKRSESNSKNDDQNIGTKEATGGNLAAEAKSAADPGSQRAGKKFKSSAQQDIGGEFGAGEETSESSGLSSQPEQPQQATKPRQPPQSTREPGENYWQDIYVNGMRRHMECERRKKELDVHQFQSSDLLTEDDPIYAIAAFWEGLRQQGRHMAYGGIDVFFAEIEGVGIVGAPRYLIMPMFIHSQRMEGAKPVEQTSEIGHNVLIVAKWDEKENNVSFTLWDSLRPSKSVEKKGEYIKEARKLILREGSQWPYDQMEKNAERRPLTFDDSGTVRPSPQQPEGCYCGFYVVLNAWCLMLGIPIAESRVKRKMSDQEFFRQGLHIMNLAMRGCMEAQTVQAFLILCGYTEEPSQDSRILEVTAAPMNKDLLGDALGQLYQPSVAQIARVKDAVGKRFTIPQIIAQLKDQSSRARPSEAIAILMDIQ